MSKFKIIYFLLFKSITSIKLPVIRNLNFPICSNCLHFIEHKNNYPYSLPDSSEYGRCKMFGYVDIISGQIEFDFAKHCRNDINKCGNNGLYFENKINITTIVS